MKTFALAASILAISAAGASAADMAPRTYTKAPVLVAPIFNWTGFYGGLNAGYADPTAKFSVAPGGSWIGDPDLPGTVNAGTQSLGLRGFTGGGQAGYNYQVDKIVLGIEGDANYLGLKKSYVTPVFPGVFSGTYGASGSVGLDALYTLRGRLGFAADHWLFFVTGGLAVTSEKFSQSINFVNEVRPVDLPITGAAGGANAGSAGTTAASWTLGGGAEYALNKQWSVKGEYLYVNLNSMSFGSAYSNSGPFAAFFPGTYTIQHNINFSGLNIFRVGLNYHL
jgi:outer membrane immunogenic protein